MCRIKLITDNKQNFDLEVMKHTYASKRMTSHGMAIIRSYRHFERWPHCQRGCSDGVVVITPQLVTGETRVRFWLGATCSSFHMRCVPKVKLDSCLLSDIYLYKQGDKQSMKHIAPNWWTSASDSLIYQILNFGHHCWHFLPYFWTRWLLYHKSFWMPWHIMCH